MSISVVFAAVVVALLVGAGLGRSFLRTEASPNHRPWWVPEVDMRAIVVLIVFALFAWAFGNAPNDETMKGALIAAFAAAWGYYLGSSRSTTETRQQITDATNQAREATALAREINATPSTTDEVQAVRIEQPHNDPVPTTETKATGERYAWEKS